MIRRIAFSCLLLPLFLLCGCNGADRLEEELEDALDLLDEEIMSFPQTMKEHYDKVNALTDSLENTSDVNLKLKLYASLIDDYSQLSADTMTIYSEQMLALAGQCKDKDAEVYATMGLCGVAQMKEDFSGSLNRFTSLDPSGASDEAIYNYYLRGESVYYSLFVRAFNAPEDIYLNHHASYYRDKLAQLRSICLQMDSTSFKAQQIRISELRDSERYAEALDLLKSIRHLADTPMRIASWAEFTVKKTGKRFIFLNTHLDNSGKEARRQSVRMIARKLKEINADCLPTVVTGDFNNPADHYIMDAFRGVVDGVRESAPVTDDEYTYTAWDGSGTKVIDHIFSRGFNIKEYRTVTDRSYIGIGNFIIFDTDVPCPYLSDHDPITAVLEL